MNSLQFICNAEILYSPNSLQGGLQVCSEIQMEKSSWPQGIRDQRSIFAPSCFPPFFRLEERDKRNVDSMTAIHVGGTAPGIKCHHHSCVHYKPEVTEKQSRGENL